VDVRFLSTLVKEVLTYASLKHRNAFCYLKPLRINTVLPLKVTEWKFQFYELIGFNANHKPHNLYSL
jgi:hypothetical protein